MFSVRKIISKLPSKTHFIWSCHAGIIWSLPCRDEQASEDKVLQHGNLYIFWTKPQLKLNKVYLQNFHTHSAVIKYEPQWLKWDMQVTFQPDESDVRFLHKVQTQMTVFWQSSR